MREIEYLKIAAVKNPLADADAKTLKEHITILNIDFEISTFYFR